MESLESLANERSAVILSLKDEGRKFLFFLKAYHNSPEPAVEATGVCGEHYTIPLSNIEMYVKIRVGSL